MNGTHNPNGTKVNSPFAAALFATCPNTKRDGICRDENCAEMSSQYGSRFLIRFGHAGYNSPANNRNGYSSAEKAAEAVRHYIQRAKAIRGADSHFFYNR